MDFKGNTAFGFGYQLQGSQALSWRRLKGRAGKILLRIVYIYLYKCQSILKEKLKFVICHIISHKKLYKIIYPAANGQSYKDEWKIREENGGLPGCGLGTKKNCLKNLLTYLTKEWVENRVTC